MPAGPSSALPRWALPLLLLLVCGLHMTSCGNRFVFDDRNNVMSLRDDGQPQEMIHELQPLGSYFRSHYFRGTGADSSRNFRPVTVLSYALIYQSCARPFLPDLDTRRSLDPGSAEAAERREALPQHLCNILLQVANTLLVFLLLRRWASPRSALLAAGLFGCHALHGEVVAGVVGRGELLGFFFCALTAELSLRRCQAGWSFAYTLPLALLCFLGFSSKENALGWVGMLPLLLLLQRDTANSWQRRLAAGLSIVIPAALCFALLWLQVLNDLEAVGASYHTSYLSNPLRDLEVAPRLGSAAVIWIYGIGKLLLPVYQSCDYGLAVFELQDGLLGILPMSCLMLLLGLCAAGVYCGRHRPLLFLATAAFFGFSFLISNVPMAQEAIFAERNYYSPSLGLVLLLAWLLDRRALTGRPLVLVLLGFWGLWHSQALVRRHIVWDNNDRLFLHDAEVQPRSLRLLDNVAEIHRRRADAARDPATREAALTRWRGTLRRQLEVAPDYPKALLLLSIEAMQAGQLDQATALLDRCASSTLAPRIDARETGSRLAFWRGALLRLRGQPEAALAHLARATKIDLRWAKARINLVRGLLQANRLQEARQRCNEGRQLFPDDPMFLVLHARLLFRAGRDQEVVQILNPLLGQLFARHWGRFELDDLLDLVEAQRHLGDVPGSHRLLEANLRQGGGGIPPESAGRVQRLRRGG